MRQDLVPGIGRAVGAGRVSVARRGFLDRHNWYIIR
jgi:hypothetical protein